MSKSKKTAKGDVDKSDLDSVSTESIEQRVGYDACRFYEEGIYGNRVTRVIRVREISGSKRLGEISEGDNSAYVIAQLESQRTGVNYSIDTVTFRDGRLTGVRRVSPFGSFALHWDSKGKYHGKSSCGGDSDLDLDGNALDRFFEGGVDKAAILRTCFRDFSDLIKATGPIQAQAGRYFAELMEHQR